MTFLKLKERNTVSQEATPGTARKEAVLPGQRPARPISLIDTQTLKTIKVEMGEGAKLPAPRPQAAAPDRGLTLVSQERVSGYDPYNNIGASAVSARMLRLASFRR